MSLAGSRQSSIAPNAVESREAPPNTTVSVSSQRHPEQLPAVTGTSRGNTGYPAATRERPQESVFNASWGRIPLPWLESNDTLPLAMRMDTWLPWRHMRGSLSSPSYLVRNPTLAPQLQKTHETPPSSRDEGLLFLHGLESNLEASLQTPQEAWLPLGHSVGSRDTRWDSRGERNSLLPLYTRPDSSGESGMQPRDPCCPWRGTLCPGQKPRWGLFCPTVTREQHPSLPRNSNGRLVFIGPTQEEVWISRCNSRIPPQLLKTTWFPIHRNMRPLPATESQEKSHVSS